jgi:2'-5' RNA ligase
MDSVRAFIAIELPPAILKALGDLQDRLKQDVPPKLVRWVRPQGIHLTLKFLGDVPQAKVDAIAEALQDACAPHAPFSLSVGGMGCFPNPRRPRVVWVGVDEPSGALVRLQRDVERAIGPLGFPPEKRRFSPHLTLGRVKGRDRDAVVALGEYVSRATVRVGELQAEAVHVMRSELLPGGAVYTELAVAPLSG